MILRSRVQTSGELRRAGLDALGPFIQQSRVQGGVVHVVGAVVQDALQRQGHPCVRVGGDVVEVLLDMRHGPVGREPHGFFENPLRVSGEILHDTLSDR